MVVTSSVNGTRIFSNTGATAYSCSKAAQVAFTTMAALELARWKVRVNVVCPGAIETNIEESTEQRHLEEVRVPVEFRWGPRCAMLFGAHLEERHSPAAAEMASIDPTASAIVRETHITMLRHFRRSDQSSRGITGAPRGTQRPPLARRVRGALAAGIAVLALPALGAGPAAAEGFRNTATSSSGAYLQSSGICGGAFDFNVTSHGFEYLQIGVVSASEVAWGEWTEVPQHSSYRYELPFGYQYKAYVVQGADLVNGEWEIQMVTTWFNRITNGDNYGTWFC